MNKEFEEQDFTEEELKMLRAIFNGAEAFLDVYDSEYVNIFFHLQEKLGIWEVINSI